MEQGFTATVIRIEQQTEEMGKCGFIRSGVLFFRQVLLTLSSPLASLIRPTACLG